MRNRVFLAASVLLAALLLTRSASAQYMYLDADGDGVPTAADAVNPAGATTLDVWLRTGTNRDGSAASCVTQDGDLTINSYEFILRASNGTVSWSGFVNRRPEFQTNLGVDSDATDYHNGFGSGTILPPGTYHLASLTVQVASGTPSLAIVSSTPLSGVFITSFGSRCSGLDTDNTLKLGSDWFDTDGVPYGGVANQPPLLTQPADMSLFQGETKDQDLIATDPDGEALSFALVAGPSYATVTTLDPGSGEAHGRIRLTPGSNDVGVTTATVEARDQLIADRESLTITVTERNFAPVLNALADVTLSEGDVQDQTILASDADGDPLSFSVASGPAFVTITTISPGSPAVGRLRIAPGFADAGEQVATISVTDGALSDEKSFRITVIEPFPPHNQILCQPGDMLVPGGAVVEQTLHAASPDGEPISFLKESGPDFLTISTIASDPAAAVGKAAASPSPSTVGAFPATVAATDGVATDRKTFTIAVGDARSFPDPGHPLFVGPFVSFDVAPTPQSIASGDLDGDGIVDLVTANLSESVSILRGRGDGTFERRDDYPFGGTPYVAAIGDLNGDGRPDLAVVDTTLDVVCVVDAIGSCQFGRRRDYAVGNRPAHVKIGDWNADGRSDLVTSNEGDNSITVLIGNGDGTFGSRVEYPVGSDPCYADAADLNADGHVDLAIANENSNNISILLGLGDGTFTPHALLVVGEEPRSVEIGDLNHDGALDLAVGNFIGSTVSVLFGNGDGTFQNDRQFPTGTCPWSTALGDLNGDGHLDIVTADVCSNTASVLLGNGSGNYPERAGHAAGGLARFVVLDDANRDGHLDLLVANEGSGTVIVALGDGAGGFGSGSSYPAGDIPLSMVAGDWDRDGIRDLVAANAFSNSLSIFRGVGGGAFAPEQSMPLDYRPQRLLTGDWDHDGRADLAALSEADLVAIHRGTGSGSFGTRESYELEGFPSDIAAADLNGDGWHDLIVTTTFPNSLVVLAGGPGGVFTPREPMALNAPPVGLAVGDLNGDGLLDVSVARQAPDFVELLIGDGMGGFLPSGPVALPRSPRSVALADLNADGRLDLVVGVVREVITGFDFGDGFLEMALASGPATFGPFRELGTGKHPSVLRILDANGDGHRDIAALGGFANTISLFLGLGNGDFAPRVDLGAGNGPTSLVATDLSGDGRVDLAVTEIQVGQVRVLLNRGDFPVVDRPPVVTAPEAAGARAGTRVEIHVSASDPDDEAILLLTADLSHLPTGNDASFAANADRSAGTLTWTPKAGDEGSYPVRFVAANELSGSATTRIDVGPANRPPTAEAGGPYEGSVGVPIAFDGRDSSDPDGDALAFTWEFGDGESGVGSQPSHAYGAEGDYAVTLMASDGFATATDGATAAIRSVLPARAFTTPEDRVIRLVSGKPLACAQLEPIDRSFDLVAVDVSTVVLRSEGTGSVQEIHTAPGKETLLLDRDRNGVPELSLCFAKGDLRQLFGSVAGTVDVLAQLEGTLITGGAFRAAVSYRVIGALSFPAVAVSPNPMNPEATLTIALGRPGPLRVALFDVSGRRVRVLVDRSHVPGGYHTFRFDGRTDAGGTLASGVYFYQVESIEGIARGRISVLR